MSANASTRKTLLLAAAIAAASGARAASDEIWAADGRPTALSVESGETVVQDKAVSLSKGSRIEKTGGGELVLPLESVIQNEDFKLDVRDGKVTVSTGSAPSVATPSAVLANAALWLDADSNVVEDSGNVVEWRDCRETNGSVPFRYWHGYVYYGGDVRPVKTTDGSGRAAVDFKGYGSNIFLGLAAPSASAFNKNSHIDAYDVFVVHSVTRSDKGYGYLLGGVGDPYHPGTAGATLGKVLLRIRDAPQGDARWWQNGVEIDATRTSAALGAKVFDVKHYRARPQIHSIFRFTDLTDSYATRNGGDLVHEVLLFTNKLTEVEHAKVRRYLLDKWSLAPAATENRLLTTATGTEVEGDFTRFSVKGGGRLSPAAGTDLTWDYDADEPATAVLNLPADGGGDFLLREDVSVEAAHGRRVSAADGRSGVSVGVTAAGVPAGTLEKAGDGRLRIGGVPDGTETLKVSGGTLDISPTVVYPNLVAGSISGAVVTNASFEKTLASNCYFTNMRANGSLYYGDWTCSYAPGYVFADSYSVVGYISSGKSGWYVSTGDKTTDGTHYMAIRGECQVTGTIDVPVDGWYEAAFDLNRTTKLSSRVDVLVDSTEVGFVSYVPYMAWSHSTLRRAFLQAGRHSLVFRSSICRDGSGESYGRTGFLLDNIRFSLVAGSRREWPIPNGDFEKVVTNSDFAASCDYAGRVFSSSAGAEGWTFSQVPGSSSTLVGVVSIDAGPSTTAAATYANWSMQNGGRGQLLFASTGTVASTTFTAPAGKWLLRADVAAWRKANLTSRSTNTSEAQPGSLRATVAVGGGAQTSLGDLSLPGVKPFSGTWGTAFTVPAGGAQVTLSLNTMLVHASYEVGAIIDNLTLVSAEPDDSVLEDGDFAGVTTNPGTSTWVVDTSRKTSSGPLSRVRAGRGDVNPSTTSQYSEAPNGYDGSESGYFGVIVDCAALRRGVMFPSAGRYRLSYFTRGRWNGSSFAYSGNVLRPYVAAAGVTNAIDEVKVATTNWVAHSAVFTVPQAGAYEFGFEGLNVPTSESAYDAPGYWDKTAFVSHVRIVKVDGGEGTVSMPEGLAIEVGSGAKLRLGFEGTNVISRIKLGGRSAYGVVSAETHPGYIVGSGCLNVTSTPPGFLILCR